MKGLFKMAAVVALALGISACATNMNAPVTDRAVGPEADPTVTTPGAGVTGGPVSERFYVVERGDTLNRIAQKFGYTWQEVAAWNNLTDPNALAVGQSLRVSPPSGATAGGAVTVTPITSGGPSIGATPGAGSAGENPAPAAASVGAPATKQGPIAKVEPYSDAAWSAANRPTPAATGPSATAPAPAETTKPAAPVDLNAAWIWPADGKVLSGFDNGKTKGIDIAGQPGDIVRASAGGRVVYAGAGLRGYGKLVIIKHDADYLSAYAHNRSLLVKEGQSVTKGEKIAELGSTDADRPKLHFEIRRRGKPVDPLKYLPNR
jgi:lipoprotein NlpD